MTSWAERARMDPGLRAFIEAEITRAGIDVHTAKLAVEHKEAVIAELQRKLAAVEDAQKPARRK